MERNITLSQYRTIDLTMLAGILAGCQILIHFAVTAWFPEQLYVVSPVAAVTALVMMRWGPWAGLHAALGGVLYALLAGGSWEHILIYTVGNLFSMAALLIPGLLGRERVCSDAFLSLMFALAVQTAMWLGRAGIALALGFDPAACLGFITTDILSGLFTLFIIWIVRRTDGLFEDQKTYLLRLREEQQAERRDQF